MRRITLTDHTTLGTDPVRTIEVDFRGDGIYEYVWPEGHKTITVCQTDHSEMLIEHAVYAFMDRDFRGVINNGASGIDAYLNFHIEILLLAAGKSLEDVASAIKLIDRQENRRWGAFWALESQFGQGKLPELPRKAVELRNQVVHQGEVPTEEQALDYLKAVCAFVAPLDKRLHEKHRKEINKRFFAKAQNIPNTHPTIGNPTMWMRTVISHMNYPAFFPDAPFEGTVDEYIRESRKPRGQGFRKPIACHTGSDLAGSVSDAAYKGTSRLGL